MEKLEWLKLVTMLALDGDSGGESEESPEDKTDDSSEPGASGDGQDDSADDDTDADDEDGKPFDAGRALSKIRKLNSENKNLREREKKAREEAVKAGKDSGRVSELEAQVRRLQFGSKHGLPEEITDVLKGDTEAEMLQHAESLLKAFGASARRSPTLGNQRGGGSDPTRGIDDIDPDKIADAIPRL